MAILACSHPYDNSNNGNMGNPNNSYKYEMDDETAIVMFIVYSIVFIVVAGANIYLCMKCYNKRAISKRIKEQMMFKKI